MSFSSQKYPQFNSFCSGIDAEDHYWDSQVHMHTVEELLLLTHTGSCRVISNGNSYQVPTPAFIWNKAGSFHLVEEVDGIATGNQIVFHPGIFSDLHKQLLRTDFMEDSGMLALPHIRVNDILHPYVIVGVCENPISDYHGLDDQPVRVIVFTIAPDENQEAYLQLLSSISRRLRNPKLIEQIIGTVGNTVELLKVIQQDADPQ